MVCVKDDQHTGYNTVCTRETLNVEHQKDNSILFHCVIKLNIHTWFWHRIGHGLRNFVIN